MIFKHVFLSRWPSYFTEKSRSFCLEILKISTHITYKINRTHKNLSSVPAGAKGRCIHCFLSAPSLCSFLAVSPATSSYYPFFLLLPFIVWTSTRLSYIKKVLFWSFFPFGQSLSFSQMNILEELPALDSPSSHLQPAFHQLPLSVSLHPCLETARAQVTKDPVAKGNSHNFRAQAVEPDTSDWALCPTFASSLILGGLLKLYASVCRSIKWT